jgi:hypothetical protein
VTSIVVAAIIGLLLGLLWCYYKQLQAAYDNRNLISSGGNFIAAGQDLLGQIRKL